MAKVAIQVDINGPDHPLQHKECFFDGAQKRCKGLKKNTGSVGFSMRNEEDSLLCNKGGQVKIYAGN